MEAPCRRIDEAPVPVDCVDDGADGVERGDEVGASVAKEDAHSLVGFGQQRLFSQRSLPTVEHNGLGVLIQTIFVGIFQQIRRVIVLL